MNSLKTFALCVVLFTLAPSLWSQNTWTQRSFGGSQEKGIPGYLDPKTGTFTAKANRETSTPTSGTPIFFREQFNVTIDNFDQSTSDLVVCDAHIETFDSTGDWYDDAVSVATKNGNNFTCTVPILTQWTLLSPTSDTITACVTVTFIQNYTLGGVTQPNTARSSAPPCLTLPVPANGTTVNNSLTFML